MNSLLNVLSIFPFWSRDWLTLAADFIKNHCGSTQVKNGKYLAEHISMWCCLQSSTSSEQSLFKYEIIPRWIQTFKFFTAQLLILQKHYTCAEELFYCRTSQQNNQPVKKYIEGHTFNFVQSYCMKDMESPKKFCALEAGLLVSEEWMFHLQLRIKIQLKMKDTWLSYKCWIMY